MERKEKMRLKVEISNEEIGIYLEDGTEVIYWVCDEWEDDPTIIPCIANAINMAYNMPEKLIKINQKHINDVRKNKNLI